MRPQKQENSNSDNHNWDWIEGNRKQAELFAEMNDPFRKPDVVEKYDPILHDILKITAYETRIEFAHIAAKGGSKPTVAYPLGYEYAPYEFNERLTKVLNHFKKRLAII